MWGGKKGGVGGGVEGRKLGGEERGERGGGGDTHPHAASSFVPPRTPSPDPTNTVIPQLAVLTEGSAFNNNKGGGGGVGVGGLG